MRRILSSAFRLILCGLETIGLGICIPIPGAHPFGVVGTVSTSDCLRDLTIQLTATPSTVISGQSSIISWSVDLPPECGYTSLQLNGNAVAQSGSQTVTPTRSTTYRITILLNLAGASIEKTDSTRVTVTDTSTGLFCPGLPQPHSVEIWEPDAKVDKKQPDPHGTWLIDTFKIPTTIVPLGPEILLDFGSTKDNDLPSATGPDVILMSGCTILPAPRGPHLDDLVPQESGAAAM